MTLLKDIYQKKLLTPEEERHLWNNYHLYKSREDHEKIVEAYLPLVVSVVNSLSIRMKNKQERDDLVGIGVLGLHNAITLFKPAMGQAFSTFARVKIKGMILDEMRKVDHLTRGQRKKYHKICAAINKLSHELSRCPTHQELAKETGLSETDISTHISIAGEAVSLDIETEAGQSYKNIIEDKDAVSPSEAAEVKFAIEEMRAAFRMLDKRGQQLLYLKHYQGLRVKEIAEVLGISEGRVSQMYKEVLVKLRSIMSPPENS